MSRYFPFLRGADLCRPRFFSSYAPLSAHPSSSASALRLSLRALAFSSRHRGRRRFPRASRQASSAPLRAFAALRPIPPFTFRYSLDQLFGSRLFACAIPVSRWNGACRMRAAHSGSPAVFPWVPRTARTSRRLCTLAGESGLRQPLQSAKRRTVGLVAFLRPGGQPCPRRPKARTSRYTAIIRKNSYTVNYLSGFFVNFSVRQPALGLQLGRSNVSRSIPSSAENGCVSKRRVRSGARAAPDDAGSRSRGAERQSIPSPRHLLRAWSTQPSSARASRPAPPAVNRAVPDPPVAGMTTPRVFGMVKTSLSVAGSVSAFL